MIWRRSQKIKQGPKTRNEEQEEANITTTTMGFQGFGEEARRSNRVQKQKK
jgi:hypothetical protein